MDTLGFALLMRMGLCEGVVCVRNAGDRGREGTVFGAASLDTLFGEEGCCRSGESKEVRIYGD